MIELKITDEMYHQAQEESKRIGSLPGSILRGKGNTIGILGELMVAKYLHAQRPENYSIDYDIVLRNGKTIDVKTKSTSVVPLPHYDCSITDSRRQQCDFYVFTRIKDHRIGWILGWIEADKFFKLASYHKKGDIDKTNNFTFKANCYNLPIHRLNKNVLESL